MRTTNTTSALALGLLLNLVLGLPQALAEGATSHDFADSKGYDAELAQRLGADDYGMHGYVFVLLKTGPTEVEDAERRAELFRGHFANMGKLAEEGTLVLAGPFMEAEPWRGMFIFKVDSIDAAEALVQSDPAVAAGLFDYELKKYYGSAALQMINSLHGSIQKTGVE